MHVRITLPMSRRRQIEVDGRIIRLTRLCHQLVEILVMRHGQQTMYGELIELLYDCGEREPDNAYRALRAIIFRVNRDVGGTLIYSRHATGYVVDLS